MKLIKVAVAALLVGACAPAHTDPMTPGSPAEPWKPVPLGAEDLETITSSGGPDADYSAASIEGVLRAETRDGIVYFVSEAFGRREGLVVPAGFRATIDGDDVWLSDDQGERLVRADQAFTGGGGYTECGDTWVSGPTVDGCFFASPDFEEAPDGAPGDGERPALTDPEPRDGYPEAAMMGILSAEEHNGKMYFYTGSDDHRRGLILPHGYSARWENGHAYLMPNEGEPIPVGSEFATGGGGIEGLKPIWGDGPKMDTLWLAGPDVSVMEPSRLEEYERTTITQPERRLSHGRFTLRGKLEHETVGDVVHFVLVDEDGKRFGLVLPYGWRANVGEATPRMTTLGGAPIEDPSPAVLEGSEAPNPSAWDEAWGDGAEVDAYWLVSKDGETFS